MLAAFTSAARRVLESPTFPVASRLAFGAIGGQSFPSRADAYADLSRAARIRVDDGMKEMSYKVNRPKTLRGIVVNRNGHWACLKLAPPPPAPEMYAAMCEVDINTPPDFDGKWSGSNVFEVFSLLREEGVTLIESGDEA